MKNIYNQYFRRSKVIAFCGAAVVFLSVASCNDDELFEKEQYKNVFALISEGDNVARKSHQLGDESVGYIAASLGGTNPTEKDIVVNLLEDKSLIDVYNKINYDTDVSKYARALPESKYDIDNYQFIIPAGEIGGRLPVRIRPDGLSPDSTYFIALRVESHSSYEVNPEKSYVLYGVEIKNRWAKADNNTIYNMRGKLRVGDSPTELEMPGTKIMHPLTKNSVRIMVGNEAFESDVNILNQLAIVLTVGDDNKVTITPYRHVEVTQVDGDKDFPNIFMVEDDGFKTYKTFLLRYNFKIGDTNYEMKEELRMEFNEEDEEEEKDR